MDTTKVFDTLDRKIERLLARLTTLESENDKLRSDLQAARKAEKEAGDSKGIVEKLRRSRTPCGNASGSSSRHSRRPTRRNRRRTATYT